MTPAPALLPVPRTLRRRRTSAPRAVQLRLVAVEVSGDADALLDLFGRLAADPRRTESELACLRLLAESAAVGS